MCGHWVFLHRSVSGSAPLLVRVMGHVPVDWEGTGWLSTLVDTAYDGADATAERGQDVDIPSPGGGDGGGRTAGDRNLLRPFPKHCCTIYFDKANYVPVSISGLASGGAGFEVVMGSG